MKREYINKIEFKDGRIDLEKDELGNYVCCFIGDTAHRYMKKFRRINPENLPIAFEMFNSATLII